MRDEANIALSTPGVIGILLLLSGRSGETFRVEDESDVRVDMSLAGTSRASKSIDIIQILRRPETEPFPVRVVTKMFVEYIMYTIILSF